MNPSWVIIAHPVTGSLKALHVFIYFCSEVRLEGVNHRSLYLCTSKSSDALR